MAPQKRTRSGFGQATRMRSGRWQARYTGPDGALHTGPSTYDAKVDAQAWLVDERRLIAAGVWTPPKARAEKRLHAETFATYAGIWLEHRDLRPRTRAHYRSLLERHINPTFGQEPLAAITPSRVRAWHAALDLKTPTVRAHAYGLLRTVLATAVHDGEIPANPCHIRGAGNVKRARPIRTLTATELAQLVDAMPPKHRALTLMSVYCALRFGEAAALRRSDIDLETGIIRVRRGVVRVGGKATFGPPKSDAGVRDVHMPRLVVDAMREHLRTHISGGREGLVFPGTNGGPLNPSSLYGKAPQAITNKRTGETRERAGWGFYAARVAAGRPDLRWHDLRHTGAVLAGQAGATLAELMSRLGHSTPAAALRYQHAAQGRDAAIAARIDQLASGSES
jgi:integrase